MTWPEGVDPQALGDWMDREGLGSGPLEAPTLLAGGTQNVVLLFQRGGERFVLRRPSVHHGNRLDATMRREARMLAALAGSQVPHPRLLGACDADSPLGAAFYLMEAVDGFNPATGLPERFLEPGWRRAMAFDLMDCLAALAAVDHQRAGLGDVGNPEGFNARQVARWRAQFESYQELDGYRPEIGDIDEVGRWLEAHRPPEGTPGILHGDYHFANVLVHHDRPEIAAVIDWELATIGDPLLDLGSVLATWPETDGTAKVTPLISQWADFPAPSEMLDRYADRSARDLSHIRWYQVLACYRLGIILEGTKARASVGRADVPTGEKLHEAAVALIARAQELLSS